MISRLHAKLVQRSEDKSEVYVVDEDSVNGTWYGFALEMLLETACSGYYGTRS
jgi:hypothetical protein